MGENCEGLGGSRSGRCLSRAGSISSVALPELLCFDACSGSAVVTGRQSGDEWKVDHCRVHYAEINPLS